MSQDQTFAFDLAQPFPHLSSAPIVEAVIHWLARARRPLDPAWLERQLAERLPDYPYRQPQHDLQFLAHFGTAQASPSAQSQWRGFRLTSSDKLHVAQFTQDGLVFSRLAPYASWDVFAGEACRLWNYFVELAEPSEVERLGVRFINRIRLAKIDDIARYLARPPKSLDPLNLPISEFLYQTTHEVPSHALRIKVSQTVQPPAPPRAEGFGLILDIDVGTAQAFPPDNDIVADRLEKMRWLKNKVFFSLLSRKALLAFQKEK